MRLRVVVVGTAVALVVLLLGSSPAAKAGTLSDVYLVGSGTYTVTNAGQQFHVAITGEYVNSSLAGAGTFSLYVDWNYYFGCTAGLYFAGGPNDGGGYAASCTPVVGELLGVVNADSEILFGSAANTAHYFTGSITFAGAPGIVPSSAVVGVGSVNLYTQSVAGA